MTLTPVLLSLATALVLGAATFAAEIRQAFDDQPAGKPPAGWTSLITGEGAPIWRVVDDASAPSPSRVLEQSGLVPKPSFPLCLLAAPTVQDGFVEVKFKTLSGNIDQAAGLVWRARDATNYYVCRANALEDNAVLYKVENGQRTALDIVGRSGGYGVETKVAPAVWQTLRVEFSGSRHRVLLNQRELFAVEDGTFPETGRVGLWTKADSVIRFDDFRAGSRP